MLPVAILAGGLGNRVKHISKSVPKSLILFNGKPFLEWQLQLLEKNNCKKVVICVSHKSEMIAKYIKNRSKSSLKTIISNDGEYQLGTGGALIKAKELLGPAFMVIYGDSFLPIDFNDVAETFQNSNKIALMTIVKNDLDFEPSNVYFKSGCIERYDKKNPDDSMTFIDFGLSAFKHEAFNGYESDQFLDLSTIQTKLAAQRNLLGYQVHKRYYEIGSPKGIEDFERYIGGI
jgi:NDP-sugar pyrophosphorylase family protein